MALPPSIPTSFVPHPGSAAPRRFRGDLIGAFGYFAYGILAIAVVLALSVFFYDRILAGTLAAKEQAVKEAKAKIDPTTVEGFLRLRDRLSSGKTLLDKHISFSGFFAAAEKLLPSTVRFTTLNLVYGDVGKSKLEGSGTAKSFNALAAASNAFATDGRIKDAIFSNITVNRDGSVSFILSATIDPKLVAFAPSATDASSDAGAAVSGASSP